MRNYENRERSFRIHHSVLRIKKRPSQSLETSVSKHTRGTTEIALSRRSGSIKPYALTQHYGNRLLINYVRSSGSEGMGTETLGRRDCTVPGSLRALPLLPSSSLPFVIETILSQKTGLSIVSFALSMKEINGSINIFNMCSAVHDFPRFALKTAQNDRKRDRGFHRR